MKTRKMISWFIIIIVLLVIGYAVRYAWQAFPIISGYGAKNLASAVFVQHRNAADVIKEDLGTFPLTIGSFTVDEKDSSVTGTVFGLAKRKAIYRKGLGCTLVNGLSEEEIRSQHFDLPSTPIINADTIPWPYGDKITNAVPSNIDTGLLSKAIDKAMHETDEKGKPCYTRAVLVIYDGQIVAEEYAPGFDKNSVMLGWSMSKSLTAAMIGILVKQGKLNVDAPAPVPEWKGTNKESITLKQLLQQTSGLDFKEDYANPSEVTNMLFKQGDMAAFTAARPLKNQPGAVYNYSSGNSNLLSRIMRQSVGEKQYAAFPYTALFHKINCYSMLLEPDASGTYIGSSYSYATARDFARFGLLYYNNGLWNGEQILPGNWVQQSIQPSTADKQKHYGYQFWLNGFDEKDLNKRMFPNVPVDMYFADGFGGQRVFIIPSKKLIVVRMGLHDIDFNRFLEEILQAVK